MSKLPLAPRSVSDRIHELVRHEILGGKYLPGDVLRQDDLAARFGVSKIPLREAFSRLESEGMLVLRPRRGYAVASLDQAEIVEIFELRALIETHAARLAAEHHQEEDAGRVTRLAGDMMALDRNAADYHSRWCQLNRDFHGAIIQACRQRHVIRMALQLRDIIEPYIRLDTTMSTSDAAADREHNQIATAFVARNSGLVGALSAAHCYHTRDRLLASLRAQGRAA
ncbi:GntR family transcriptional regulator [Pigmentiphaga sp. H8]|uniref:GntR family transcriptional regulator n=1 Tax=Pigmentiphaga sp. H8 TaxID=2488560 RepID=UPI002108440F|nr:GntR family transcriptional regulator [Pigmentiphaga sp. H8]